MSRDHHNSRRRVPRRGHGRDGRPFFSLGRWGIPVNALALLYGLLMTVNLAWPRAAVYDPAGGHWYFRWFTVLFLAATVAVGVACRVCKKRAVTSSGAAEATAQEAAA